MNTTLLDVESAMQELRGTSMEAIERKTALTWGARALASYRLSSEANALSVRFRHFYEGENYRQEALEHASMAEDRGALLQQIHDELERVRPGALAALRGARSAA